MNRNVRSLLNLLAFCLVGAAAPAASAQMIEQELASPRRAEPASPRPEILQGTLGVRTMLIRSSGFDPFSGTDALPQISLGIQHPFARYNAFGFSAGLGADYGESNATARGAASSLTIWRLSAVAEGRYYAWQHVYGFARFAPGMLRAGAELVDASSPNGENLEDHFDGLSIDGSAGAAIRVSGPVSPVGAWIIAEGGYGWAQSHHLMLAPQAAPRDQAKLVPVDLGNIDPRGAFFRLALAVTY